MCSGQRYARHCAPPVACGVLLAAAILGGRTHLAAGEAITVYAAASLVDAVSEAANAFEAQEGIAVRTSFAGSALVARQIERGAPADVFISASRAWMEYLLELDKIVPETVAPLFRNRVVLVAPTGHDVRIEFREGFAFADAFAGRLAIADPEAMPAGIYAREALVHLGWWDGIRDRLAPAADVRAALTYVERGDCSLGIVYATDARASDGVHQVGIFPATSHRPIVYSGGIVAGQDRPATRRFLSFLGSPAAAAIFTRHGFLPAPSEGSPIRDTAPGATPSKGSASGTAPSARPVLASEEIRAVALSVRVAALATLVELPFAIAVAWLLARGRFRGKALLDGAVHVPLVLPPVVTGYVLLLLLGRHGPIGSVLYGVFGLQIAFTWKAAVVAAAVVSFPLAVRAIRDAIEAIDPRLEAAARSLGAGPWRAFVTVTLPLAAPGLLSGAILAFARGMGEFGATIAVAANIPGQTQTLPLAIFTFMNRPGGQGAALRLAAISAVVGFVAILASGWLSRRMRRAK